MTLTFYKQSATPNRIDKSQYLSEMGKVDNVKLIKTTNELTPDFVLETNNLVYNSNYFFCELTSRYYYMTGIDFATGGRIIVHSRVDVLMTFRNEILSSTSWVDRSDNTTDIEDDYNFLHNDYPFRQDYMVLGKSTSDSIFHSYALGSGLSAVLIMK